MGKRLMENPSYTAIGLMSGTSLDGIDAALIRTDGETYTTPLGHAFLPYPSLLQEKLRTFFHQKPDSSLTETLTHLNAQATSQLIKNINFKENYIDIIGYHGQTIYHKPERGETCQLGDGALLATLTNIDVVNDFRSSDMKAGGQGAPLVPIYHQVLAQNEDKPITFLNIGGVANITYIGSDGYLLAFDTGPGNALLDDWIRSKTKFPFDNEGKIARQGTIDFDILQRMLSHPYFQVSPPKSLDRNTFASSIYSHLKTQDGAATLCAFTVKSIIQALNFLPQSPKKWIVCGGGRHNLYLLKFLEMELKVPVHPIEKIGYNGNSTEAEAFAYLAVRHLRQLPYSFPTTTGVKTPMTGGQFHSHKENIYSKIKDHS